MSDFTTADGLQFVMLNNIYPPIHNTVEIGVKLLDHILTDKKQDEWQVRSLDRNATYD